MGVGCGQITIPAVWSYLSAVSDHAPGTGMTVKQAGVDYFDAATVVRVVSRLYDRHEHGVVRTHHADYGWRCRDG